MILRRMFETRDVQEEGVVQSKSLRHDRFGLFPITGKKPVVLDPVINHRDSLTGQSKESSEIARGIFADGNDCILAPGEPAGDDSPVKHAFPVVFAGDMKRSQIMNSCSEGAGLWPKHAPITGHMQQVESMLPR